MNPERDDPILDSCLDEVLGGRKAPDLTARILKALAERRQQAGPLAAADENLVQANGQMVSLRRDDRPRKARRKQIGQWLIVAATVGGLGIALGIAAIQFSRQGAPNEQVAIKDQTDKGGAQRPDKTGQGQREIAKQPDRRSAPPQVVKGSDAPTVIPLPLPGSKGTDDSSAPPATNNRRYAHQPLPDEELVSFVNAEIQRSWAEAKVRPASPASDEEWCRRVYLRVLGRIPTNAEVTAFAGDKSPDKKQHLVDQLLGDEYADQFAQHWASVWTNVLIGRTGGKKGSLASREGLEAYLEQSLRQNKPYDAIVAELLTASGTSRPDAPDFNGAVNFLLAGLGDNATLATTRVSRVFLGQQLHCAQCHGHHSQEWSQRQYWALNSFLRQAEAQREGEVVRLTSTDFVDRRGVTKDGEVYYQEHPTGQVKAAEPEFIDGTKIPPSGKLADVNRRQELARLVVNSREMPRALVNRLWSHFFGFGFTSPIDDMGPHNEPSHPEVLDALAGQFAAHNYDLKRAIRWMVLTDAFSRSSRTATGGLADMPETGRPLFSRYYTRPMKAEDLSRSLLTAANLRQKSAGGDIEQSRRDFLEELFRKSGNDDEEEMSHEGGNVQSELMMNSRFTRRVVSSEQEGRLKDLIARKELPFAEKVDHLFLAALSRKPTAQEQQDIGKIMASAKDNEGAALEDIWWALLNSNEFILDH
ncbi:MAG TPA: DUF1549 domain-containing protein [Pirellulaceae bacterium]|nr:DUF1549 domain-containing protein [Pirellulaceae bacterium]